MTQEEYRRMQMQKQAAPLSNQVFQPVQVTQVPSANYQAQEPQITPEQRDPTGMQMFQKAMAAKMAAKGVDAVTGLPIMTSLGFSKGDEVPHTEPAPRPQAIGPLAQSQDEINKWYQETYDKPHDPNNLDDPYLDNIRDLIDPEDPMLMAQKQGVVFDLRVLPPRLRSEYIQRLNSGMRHDEIIRLFESRAGKPRDYMQGTIQRYNEGGDVTYAQTGRLASVRAPLAKPTAIDKGTPGLTHPKGTTHGEYWGRPSMWQKYKSGAYPYTIPSMLRRRVDAHNQAAYKANLKDGDQGIIFRGGGGSTDNETNWEYAQRTGDIRTPFNNVVFTPEKQGATISYKRDDVKPFTWMWNKGRDFLGFGAPLAGRSK